MVELAYNINGEPFDVPPTMAAWRVRKIKSKGAPEVVYGRDGLPLILPMDADIEDLRRDLRPDVPPEGRYRLDPVDDHNRTVPNATASYVCLPSSERTTEPTPPAAPATVQTDATGQLIAALLESQKQHTELARMYVSQFPVLANAMAAVIRSAGDVGLTARVPLVMPVAPEAKPTEANGDQDGEPEDDEDEIDEEFEEIESQPEYSWPRFAQNALDQVTPYLGPLLSSIKLPGMDARPATKEGSGNAPTAEPSKQEKPAADLGAHLAVIRAALTPQEGAFIMAMAEEMPLPTKLAWANKLRAMSVPEAVRSIRAELAELERNRANAERARTTPNATTSAPAPRAPRRREGHRTVTPSAPNAPNAPRKSAYSHAAPMHRPVTVPPPAVLDLATQSHLAAIQRELTTAENIAMRSRFAALSPADRAAEVATLLMLPVQEAVATIRTQINAPRGNEQGDVAAEHAGKRSVDALVPEVAPRNLARLPADAEVLAGTSIMAERPELPPSHETIAKRETTPPLAASVPAATPTHATSVPAATPTHAASEVASNAHTHLAAIERALSPDELTRVHAMFAAMPVGNRQTWLEKLCAASALEGAALLREALQPRRSMKLVNDGPGGADEPEGGHDDSQEPNLGGPLHDAQKPARDEAFDDAQAPDVSDDEEPDDAQAHDDDIDEKALEHGDDTDEGAPEYDDDDDLDEEPAAQRDPGALEATDHELNPSDRVRRTTPPSPRTQTALAATTSPALPTLDPAALMHFAAIEDALTLAEKMRAHELAAQRPATELRAWIDELSRLSVPEAIAKIRAALASTDLDVDAAKKGGLS